MGLKSYPSSEIPSQGGQSGKYLTTDGNTPSWGTISAGGMTELLTGSFSGLTTSIGTIPSGYKELVIRMRDAVFTGGSTMRLRFNNNTGAVYNFSAHNPSTTSVQNQSTNLSYIDLTQGSTLEQTRVNNLTVTIPEYADGRIKYGQIFGYMTRPGQNQVPFQGIFHMTSTTAAITSAQFFLDSGNFTGGTYIVYGVN